jgi:hypothetical protein
LKSGRTVRTSAAKEWAPNSAKNDSTRLAGGGAHVGRGQQIRNDDDTPRAGGEHFGEVRALDPADAERGDARADLAFHRGDVLQANARAAQLGGRGKQRAEADVIEALRQRRARLFQRMGRAADEFSGTHDFPRRGQWPVVLAEVHAIRAELRGEFREIIQDERHSRRAAQRQQSFRHTADAGGVMGFGAQLQQIRAAF